MHKKRENFLPFEEPAEEKNEQVPEDALPEAEEAPWPKLSSEQMPDEKLMEIYRKESEKCDYCGGGQVNGCYYCKWGKRMAARAKQIPIKNWPQWLAKWDKPKG